MQTTPYDEHLRDSAPDNSRFDGFDRGDSGRNEDPGYEDIEATPRKPRKPSIVPVHTCSSERRARRKLCRELGRRQYRRATCRSYALKAETALTARA